MHRLSSEVRRELSAHRNVRPRLNAYKLSLVMVLLPDAKHGKILRPFHIYLKGVSLCIKRGFVIVSRKNERVVIVYLLFTQVVFSILKREIYELYLVKRLRWEFTSFSVP